MRTQIRTSIALALLAVGVGAATAGVTNDKAGAPAVAQPEERATAGKAPELKPREKGRTIRCWQYGRLILEEPVVGTPALGGQAYQLRRPNDLQGLQLLDLRSGGVCVIG